MAIEDARCFKRTGTIPNCCDEVIVPTEDGFECTDCKATWTKEED